MLFVNNLTCRYTGEKTFTFQQINCPSGQNLLISGASGSGKTTLLHLIAGILKPLKGSVVFGDQDISGFTQRQADQFRGRNIGMIFQKNFFIQGLNVYENLIAAQRLSGNPINNSYLDELMANLSIASLRDKRPDTLSQGEQQRFSIARAMANKPSWIIADEPTSSLDDENCNRFMELIRLTADKASWIIATHDNRLKGHFSNIIHI
jgi:ABC-type lipoprotein export system ATPase subunit